MFDLEELFARLVLDRREEHADLAAGHQLHQLGLRNVARGNCLDLVPVAQDRNAIGDLLDLAHAVRHVDDADPGCFEFRDEIEKLCRLGVGERRRRFVEDQEPDFGQERLGDLHHLLVSARQLRDLVVGTQIEIELADDGAGARPHGGAIEEAPGGDFTAEKKVLLDGQLGHQAELLEYRANADDPGAMRRQIGDLPALIFEGAGVGRECAGDDVDQR